MNLTDKKYRLLHHITFWSLWFLYRLTNSLSSKSLKGDYWWGDIAVLHVLFVDLVFMVAFAYGVVYFIIPKFLDTKKYGLFFLFSFIWFYFIAALFSAIFYFYLENLYTVYLWGNAEM